MKSCFSHDEVPLCIVSIVVELVDMYGEHWLTLVTGDLQPWSSASLTGGFCSATSKRTWYITQAQSFMYSYTMPTTFLSSIIHKVISVRPEAVARRSNGYYWVCNGRFKLGRYGIICLYHDLVPYHNLLYLTDIDIYNLRHWKLIHWKLIHCIDMRLRTRSPFAFVVPSILFYWKDAAKEKIKKRRCYQTSKHSSFVLFLR